MLSTTRWHCVVYKPRCHGNPTLHFSAAAVRPRVTFSVALEEESGKIVTLNPNPNPKPIEKTNK